MGQTADLESKIIADCDYVLKELDCRNVKALYRRKEVYKSQKKYSDALRDLDLLLQIDSSDAKVKQEIHAVFTLHTE